jgi:hypothetical protein
LLREFRADAASPWGAPAALIRLKKGFD